jgi:hypothetical protein
VSGSTPKKEHEHRGHQGAAAHAGKADDNADSKGGDSQRQVEAHGVPAVCVHEDIATILAASRKIQG